MRLPDNMWVIHKEEVHETEVIGIHRAGTETFVRTMLYGFTNDLPEGDCFENEAEAKIDLIRRLAKQHSEIADRMQQNKKLLVWHRAEADKLMEQAAKDVTRQEEIENKIRQLEN